MMTRMQEDVKAGREDMKAGREEMMVIFGGHREGTKSDPEQTEPSPEMMHSLGEQQEVPREEAAVIPVRGRKRRHRDRKQAAG
jgi:hypothetical protein